MICFGPRSHNYKQNEIFQGREDVFQAQLSFRMCERREAVNDSARAQARKGTGRGVDSQEAMEEAPKSADSRANATDGARRALVRRIVTS